MCAKTMPKKMPKQKIQTKCKQNTIMSSTHHTFLSLCCCTGCTMILCAMLQESVTQAFPHDRQVGTLDSPDRLCRSSCTPCRGPHRPYLFPGVRRDRSKISPVPAAPTATERHKTSTTRAFPGYTFSILGLPPCLSVGLTLIFFLAIQQ